MNLRQVLSLRTIVLQRQCKININTRLSCFSSEVPQSGLQPSRRTAGGQQGGGEDQANVARQRVRGCQAHPTGLPRRPNQTQNFTGPSFVCVEPGGGRHDHHQLRLAPRGLPARIQTEGRSSV